MARVYLSIGSNLDEPVEQVRRAIDALRALGIVSAVSSFYRTKPWGGVADQPDFINAVVALETQLEPHELLLQLKATEARLGRGGETLRWGPRVIDMDILTYDDRIVDDADLKIPHPRMMGRAFVLVPLAELNRSFQSAIDDLSAAERSSVVKL